MALGDALLISHGDLSAERCPCSADEPIVEGEYFVCYAEEGDRSCWAPVSPKQAFHQASRKPVRVDMSDYREGGPEAWRAGSCFLIDGKQTYRGNTADFLAAARPMPECDSPARLTPAGVARVADQVRYRRGFTTPE
ncbi:MAG: hypothetical protein KF745_13710 [Phycisphaeraceae bacterium]|nr:hypothetical protein [Phycisphaeraceae bacterium]